MARAICAPLPRLPLRYSDSFMLHIVAASYEYASTKLQLFWSTELKGKIAECST